MLQEPQLSPYDLQFQLFGFPVRIAWGFWIGAAVIGWNNVSYVDAVWSDNGWATPGTLVLLLVHALSLLISILVHELGHTFAFRYFGADSRIVLYHFGGLAIPGSFTDWNAARRRFPNRPQELIAISAAGPLLQLLLGIFVLGLITYFGVEVNLTYYLRRIMTIPDVAVPESATLFVFLDTMVFVSVFWSILNLLPIMPLDGGQILREILRWRGLPNPINTAALVSMITAGLVGLYAFQNDQPANGLMCIALAASNFQIYQATRYGGGIY